MCKEAVSAAEAFAKEQRNREYIPIDQRERLIDTFDLRVKEHLTWLGNNWSSIKKKKLLKNHHLQRLGQDFLHLGVINTNGKNDKSNPCKNKIGGDENEVWRRRSSWKRVADRCHE